MTDSNSKEDDAKARKALRLLTILMLVGMGLPFVLFYLYGL
jgi:hypothetical protein